MVLGKLMRGGDVVSPRVPHAGWREAVTAALALLGTAISAYLTWVHYSGGAALCAGAGGCEQVQASRYASVAGVPVALLGLVLYIALTALALWRLRAGGSETLRIATFGLALTGVLYSAYLTYLEVFVIGALCPWCVSSAVVLVALCVLAAWDLGTTE
jgi:uncharacterized membrane protein